MQQRRCRQGGNIQVPQIMLIRICRQSVIIPKVGDHDGVGGPATCCGHGADGRVGDSSRSGYLIAIASGHVVSHCCVGHHSRF